MIIDWFVLGELLFFCWFLQMTLADYSLSDVVFDGLVHWKNMLAEAAVNNSNNNNNTESLAELVQLLEEFIDIARSELTETTVLQLASTLAGNFSNTSIFE